MSNEEFVQKEDKKVFNESSTSILKVTVKTHKNEDIIVLLQSKKAPSRIN